MTVQAAAGTTRTFKVEAVTPQGSAALQVTKFVAFPVDSSTSTTGTSNGGGTGNVGGEASGSGGSSGTNRTASFIAVPVVIICLALIVLLVLVWRNRQERKIALTPPVAIHKLDDSAGQTLWSDRAGGGLGPSSSMFAAFVSPEEEWSVSELEATLVDLRAHEGVQQGGVRRQLVGGDGEDYGDLLDDVQLDDFVSDGEGLHQLHPDHPDQRLSDQAMAVTSFSGAFVEPAFRHREPRVPKGPPKPLPSLEAAAAGLVRERVDEAQAREAEERRLRDEVAHDDDGDDDAAATHVDYGQPLPVVNVDYGEPVVPEVTAVAEIVAAGAEATEAALAKLPADEEEAVEDAERRSRRRTLSNSMTKPKKQHKPEVAAVLTLDDGEEAETAEKAEEEEAKGETDAEAGAESQPQAGDERQDTPPQDSSAEDADAGSGVETEEQIAARLRREAEELAREQERRIEQMMREAEEREAARKKQAAEKEADKVGSTTAATAPSPKAQREDALARKVREEEKREREEEQRRQRAVLRLGGVDGAEDTAEQSRSPADVETEAESSLALLADLHRQAAENERRDLVRVVSNRQLQDFAGDQDGEERASTPDDLYEGRPLSIDPTKAGSLRELAELVVELDQEPFFGGQPRPKPEPVVAPSSLSPANSLADLAELLASWDVAETHGSAQSVPRPRALSTTSAGKEEASATEEAGDAARDLLERARQLEDLLAKMQAEEEDE